MDRLVGDVDVTTFFNDRFHPLFQQDSPHQAVGTIRFYDGCGCPLTDELRPSTSEQVITLANDVIVRPVARRCEGAVFSFECAPD